jgi:hypothetical protein
MAKGVAASTARVIEVMGGGGHNLPLIAHY